MRNGPSSLFNLTLKIASAPQRAQDLREVFNGMRWIVRTGSPWRFMPNDLPPWHNVYQQTHRLFKARVFEAIVADLRALIRLVEGKGVDPTAVIFERRTLQGSVENGDTGEYDGHKKRKGRESHFAVGTLVEFLALVVTPANERDRAQVAELAEWVQAVSGEMQVLAFDDRGDTGREPELAAAG